MTAQVEQKIDYKIHSKIDQVTMIEKQAIADFLSNHLDKYGDPKPHIMNAIEYAIGDHPFTGGFVLLARAGEEIVGAVVMNKTNMSGYIPDYILVYIAVNRNFRGHGIGQELMKRSLDLAKGDIALHVEPDNPAVKLYEKVGFTNKYLEMRYRRK